MNIRLLLPTLLLPVFAAAQFLAPDTPLQQAYIQATQQDKLIFLMIESADCQQCNDVADKALQNDTLKNFIRNNFIAIRLTGEHPDLNFLKEKYNTLDGNSILFLDKLGTLVSRMNMSTSDYKRYISQCKYALTRKKEADGLRALELDALTGKLTTDNIYELMYKRKALALPVDALLEQYVRQVPADSLNSISTIQRIVRLSPVLRSKADSAVRKNAQLYNAVWNSFNPTEQVNINKDIIFKTRQKAAEEKNLAKGKEAAEYARLSYTDKEAGERSYAYNMMEFFRSTKDTAAFLKSAVDYYERFQKNLNAADIKKQDSTKMAALAKMHRLSKPPKDTTINGKLISRTVSTIRYTSKANHFSQVLNNGARSFYNMTKDPIYLKKALQWAASANEFYETPYVLDTWARLLYKVDKKNVDQAIQLEEKAIALLKTQGGATNKHNEVLNKMKQKTASLD